MYVFIYPVAMSRNDTEDSSPSSANIYNILQFCMRTTSGTINLGLVLATNVFVILPLAALVLYISVQRWLQSSRVTVSHSDHLTYHMVVNDLLSFSGLLLLCYGVNADHTLAVSVGIFIFSSNLLAHMFFDTLTCAERYLAVIHPVTYRNLKNAKGARIMHFASCSCWLLSISVAGALIRVNIETMAFLVLSLTAFSLLVVSSCSLCVLCVLVRPGPGDVGEVKKVDQSKLRAFYTILIILVAMLIRLVVTLFIDFLYTVMEREDIEMCALTQPLFWSGIPSSLMPFVLFLQREGKICCKKNKV